MDEEVGEWKSIKLTNNLAKNIVLVNVSWVPETILNKTGKLLRELV